MNLRKLAKGQECQVREHGVCNFNPETVVLAHLNMSGISGRGIKSPDLLGAWCCSACHDYIDGRTNFDMHDSARKLAFLEGMARTQYQLIKQGYIKS